MRWKSGPVLALCLILAGPVCLGEEHPPQSAPANLEPASPAEEAAHSRGTIREALDAMSLTSEEREAPPEPPREETGSKGTPWYRSRTAVILMVVAGSVIVGTTALNSLRGDT